MKLDVIVAIAGLAVAGTLPLVSRTAAGNEPRTKEQCTALFHQLNTSGNGKLTVTEAARDQDMATVLSAPSIWKNGFLTETEFTPLCATDSANGPRG